MIVLIKVREQEMLIQADLYIGQENQEYTIARKKKEIFFCYAFSSDNDHYRKQSNIRQNVSKCLMFRITKKIH